jgi:hypothetical protein
VCRVRVYDLVEVHVKSSRSISLAVALLLIAACGGAASGGSTTAPPDVTTTEGVDVTSPPDETSIPGEDDPGVVSLEDMPAECIEAFRAFLQAIEPYVEDVDFQNATMADLEALSAEMEPILAPFEEETIDCPDLDMSEEESVAAMREMAERDAPGTVAYFAWIEEFMVAGGAGGAEVSGDCETDIATLQGYVDQGGTMSDLTMGELTAVGELMTAIGTECSSERFQEWFSQEDVIAWQSG